MNFNCIFTTCNYKQNNIEESEFLKHLQDEHTKEIIDISKKENMSIKAVEMITISNSRVFIIRETPNGFFEIIFGEDGVLGKAPTAGNKIVITYLASTGADANSISAFTANSQITIGGTNYTPTITTTVNSAGGGEKE